MIIDLVSDLHIDHWRSSGIDWSTCNTGERNKILVIAGDSANSKMGVFNVLNKARDLYEHIVIVDGNHEHYNSYETVDDYCKDVMKVIKRSYPNVTFLSSRNVYKVNDTVFIGANGWYDWKIMEPAYSQKQSYYYWTQWMNDSRCIIYDKDAYDKFYAGPAQLAKKQANRLAKMVEKYQDDETINNIVVVTHTAPLVQLLTIKNDIHWDGLTASFGNSQMKKVLQKDIKKKIKVWCYGHTHERKDIIIDDVRFVNNSRGYPSEWRGPRTWEIQGIDI